MFPPVQTSIPEGLAAALGAEPREVWASSYLIAVLANEASVRALAPDIAALKDLDQSGESRSGERGESPRSPILAGPTTW